MDNNGPSHAQDVVVTDTLPAGLLDVEVLDPVTGCAITAGVLTCDLGTIPSVGETTIKVRGRVSPTFGPGPMANTASVASTTADPGLVPNEGTGEVAVAAAADLSVVKSGPAQAVPGQPGALAYTVTVHNAGPSEARDVVVADVVPAGLTFDEISSSQGGPAPPSRALSARSLRGTNASVTIVATASAGQLGSVTNTASVTSSTPDPSVGNETSSVVTAMTPQANVAVTKTANPQPVVAGQLLTYTIRTVNNGPSMAQAVRVDRRTPGRRDIGCSAAHRMHRDAAESSPASSAT